MIHKVSVCRMEGIGDCTLGGVTQLGVVRVQLAETAAEAEAYIKEYPDAIDTMLVYGEKNIRGGPVYRFCEPYRTLGCKRHQMGGNFVYTSDSRFREQINEYPLPVHDRIERELEHLWKPEDKAQRVQLVAIEGDFPGLKAGEVRTLIVRDTNADSDV